MASADDKRPIIIKKIKKGGGGGHHGGAWKVAYADFVTAMMAFFLLLWLLSSVEEDKLKSLAEFFTPTIGIKDSMGIGFEGGTTANVDGNKKSDMSPPGIILGVDVTGPTLNQDEKKSMAEGDKDSQLFEKGEESIKKAFMEDPNLRDLADNIIVEQSPEGLKINMSDSDKHPMFHPGSATLSPEGQTILTKMQDIIKIMPNFISITGHTDVTPMTMRGQDYSNWELSIERANASRRFMERVGMDHERTKIVTGKASSELLLPNEPLSPRNRRITIILLRGDYMDLLDTQVPASRELLSVPKPAKPLNQKIDELHKEEAKQPAAAKEKPIDPHAPLPGQKEGEKAGTNPVDLMKAPEKPAADKAGAPPAADQFKEFTQ